MHRASGDSIIKRADLDLFHRLMSPVWIFDIERMQIWWANQAALKLWNAASLEELRDRDWDRVSPPTQTRLQTYLEKFQQRKTVVEQWTFYPEGKAVSACCLCSGIWIGAGRLAMLVEALIGEQIERIESDLRRSTEALRHTSTPISLYTLQGYPIVQNPAAIRCYGDEREREGVGENGLCRRFVDGSIADRAMSCIQRGEVFAIEAQVQTRSGIRWHAIEVHPTRDPVTGKPSVLVNEKDITELKETTSKLNQRDRLLEGVAKATNQLLTNPDRETAMCHALEALGSAAQVDRVYLFENHRDRESGELLMSQRWEWVASGVTPQIDNPELQNAPYSIAPWWYGNLSQGEAISGLVRDLPLPERESLEAQEILSILVVPIAIEGEFWGFIGFDDCHQERQWSETEKSILMATAGSFGGAIARQRAEDKLAQLNQQLEAMVEERTAKLKATNEQLKAEIAEKAHIEEQLRHNAFHDGLTGLPNRTLFMERLSEALQVAKQNPNYLFAVLFLDLDRFKIINDSLGHSVGDRLLVEIAQRIRKTLAVRPHSFRHNEHLVARLGGDEFAILLQDIRSLRNARRIADRLQSSLTRPFELHGQEVFTTVSIGIALSSTGYEHPEELLRDADIVMYRAKALGRSRNEVFDTAMHDSFVRAIELENDLRRELADGNRRAERSRLHLTSASKAAHQTEKVAENPELNGSSASLFVSNPLPKSSTFLLHYQPIVALQSGRIEGFEALVRWQHPKFGFVSPTEFVPIAEETGTIVSLGEWVLREACECLRIWQDTFPDYPPLTIAVNLSRRQFSHPDLIRQIDRILEETGVAPETLKLEITESAIVDNPDLAREMLLQLRDRKINLCMDDFGTGYSSLSYLHRFPLDILKIDRSFISRIGVEGENSEIVKTIITLAHDLGMDAIAEGVENTAQLERLQGLGCAMGQGYLFAPPLENNSVGELLRKDWKIAMNF